MKGPKLLLLLYMAICVLCYGIRGAWERSALHRVCLLTVEATKRGATGIRVLLPDNAKAQNDINEFVRVFNNMPKAPDFYPNAPRIPPVEETVNRLMLAPKNMTQRYYFGKLFPKTATEAAVERWDEADAIIRTNIQRSMPWMDLNDPQLRDITNGLDSALRGVVWSRQSDFDKFFLVDLEKRAKDADIGLKFETTVHRLGGWEFPIFDLSKTLEPYRNNPAEMARMQKWIADAKNLYMTEPPNEREKTKRDNHHNTLESWGAMLGLRTGLSTCRPLSRSTAFVGGDNLIFDR
ncbi:hypothetical protein BJX63DRAFT_436734 [Aspergillus granulosus]|uniref:Uncharacterized protein n=1 Tax=Aspergillus granulosus TaxID=176169 RepID=A0ABR4GXV2_9EURO